MRQDGYIQALFISPHLDDAVLSCTHTMLKNNNVCVVSVFTEGPGFNKRQQEDRKALLSLGISSYEHLGLTDGFYRGFYPTYEKLFSGHIDRKDLHTVDLIIDKLKKISTDKKTKIYSCLGVGLHADHLLTYAAVTKLFPKRVSYWEDMPYRTNATALFTRLAQINRPLKRKAVIGQPAKKKSAVSYYKTQVQGLLQNGLGDIDYMYEVLYE